MLQLCTKLNNISFHLHTVCTYFCNVMRVYFATPPQLASAIMQSQHNILKNDSDNGGGISSRNELPRQGYCSLISERERHFVYLQYKVALSGSHRLIHIPLPFSPLRSFLFKRGIEGRTMVEAFELWKILKRKTNNSI